jgi:ATP-dependent RNA helicase DDX35
VVVATNIAETSITLEGVVYVVDACFTKETCFDPHQGVQTLMVAPASKANAVQRAGRAGRVRPGHCYRVCTVRPRANTTSPIPRVHPVRLGASALR